MQITKASDLLTYQNPRRAQLEPLIEQSRKDSSLMGTSYLAPVNRLFRADLPTVEKRHDKLRAMVKEKLSGKILVNLGCGNPGLQDIAGTIARALDLRYLINVDLNPSIMHQERDYRLAPTIILNENAEMLDFVSRLPPESVNFLISGIDEVIMIGGTYSITLAAEIRRTTERGGLVISHASVVGGILTKLGFQILKEADVRLEQHDLIILEKQEVYRG